MMDIYIYINIRGLIENGIPKKIHRIHWFIIIILKRPCGYSPLTHQQQTLGLTSMKENRRERHCI